MSRRGSARAEGVPVKLARVRAALAELTAALDELEGLDSKPKRKVLVKQPTEIPSKAVIEQTRRRLRRIGVVA